MLQLSYFEYIHDNGPLGDEEPSFLENAYKYQQKSVNQILQGNKIPVI